MNVLLETWGAHERRWKRYPTYRDSGVEWLGAVPEGWELLRIKQLAQRIQTGSTPPTQELHYYENGSIPWFGPGSFGTDLVLDKAVKLISKTAVKDGVARIFKGQSTMIVTIGATLGKVGYIESSASSNQQITVVTFDMTRAIPKFAAYQIKRLEPVLRGIAPNTTLPILNQSDIGHLPFCLPSIPEQRAIAAFLDRETGRIDALIVKKERQIELLQEKRAALISHAVTKGLDPDAPMKDSGVEWLEEVPERWGVKQFKRVTTRVDVGIAEAATHAYADEGVPIIRSTNVRPGRILMDDLLHIHEWFAEKNRSKYLFANDLLTVRTGAPGTTAVIPPELHECQCFTMLISTLKTRQIPQFYSYFLNSSNARFRFAVEGWGTAQINISVPILQQQIIAEPPENEQRAIATFLDHETGCIDALTTKVHESISKLREYRTALISAAVTGKIDVREELAT